ncbi:hypothetical protein AKJ09_00587 [Labilithrix luteola]|uniref:Uncharacterized protein n=1 Tax=Labilithrix luteola TaxID=1391654 RepID=A0A0K1PK54_9BACT|nr:hypothetical protein AKJ09_00587 [Labilithrix luteola]
MPLGEVDHVVPVEASPDDPDDPDDELADASPEEPDDELLLLDVSPDDPDDELLLLLDVSPDDPDVLPDDPVEPLPLDPGVEPPSAEALLSPLVRAPLAPEEPLSPFVPQLEQAARVSPIRIVFEEWRTRSPPSAGICHTPRACANACAMVRR